MVTPKQARAELARRELARRESTVQPIVAGPDRMVEAFNRFVPKFSATAPMGEETTITPTDIMAGTVPLKGLNLISTGIREGLKPQVKEAIGFEGISDKPVMREEVRKGFLPKSPADVGMLLGGQISPKQATEFGLDLALDPRTYMVGGGVAEQAKPGLVSKPLQGLSKITEPITKPFKSIRNVVQPVKFAQKVRGATFGLRQKIGQGIDDAINNFTKVFPERGVDLSDEFNYIKSAMDNVAENPGLAADVKGILRKVKNPEIVKTIQGLINNPESAVNLTLRQVQDIKKAIRGAPSIASKMKQGRFANWTQGDQELLDLIDNVKTKQLEAFPELAEKFAPYAEYMRNWNVVKNSFKPQSLLQKMRGGFGNEEIEQMVQKVLPKDIYKELRGFRNIRNITKAGVGAGVGLLGLKGAEALIKSIKQ